ncbi:MAG: hypothetical protein J0H27_15320 [Xanthomonadales bacterium]|nr:hypothetical protein [Xanthomonadales bacterium]ODU92104.1 MAG: hypothetical protein ABT18_13590 [Rhodanobacter sp. SCN 66-43]OJY86032.1 MAG: hypothetical protein BGP23_05100 [Xanthomonadales bacterium 66-474]
MIFASAPSVHADLLALRRAGWVAIARTFIGPVLLVLACGVLAAIPLYWDLGWLVLASAVLALVGSHALTRHRLTAALVRARFGWCGALPVRTPITSGILIALTLGSLIATVLSGSLLLAGAAIPAPRRDALAFGLLAMDGGLLVGSLVAVVQALRKGDVARSRHVDGIREPLFALPWLNDPRLPHLLDWQRRSALVRWRSGGGFALVGVVLAGVPMGAAIFDVAGLVLLALALAWLAVVTKACMTVANDARELLGATPVPAGRMRRGSLRYPLIALLGATFLAAFGVLLLRGGLVSMVVWVVCAAAVSLRPLLRIIKTMPPGRSP